MLVDGKHFIYSSENGAVFQCDDTERFIIRFHGEDIEFKPCAFFAFKRKIKSIDVATWITDDHADVEIIPMPHCDRIFVFDLKQILELRELLSGTFTMLSLNSLIHRQLVRTT